MNKALEDAECARDEIEMERDEFIKRLTGILPHITSVTEADIARAGHEIRWLADALVEPRLKSAQDEVDRLDQMDMDRLLNTRSARLLPAGA